MSGAVLTLLLTPSWHVQGHIFIQYMCLNFRQFEYIPAAPEEVMKKYEAPMAQQPLVGQGLLIIEASRSHSRHTTLDRIPLHE
jgi:hypothetical protein